MPDIAMCKNNDCPIKEDCYRYTAIADEYWQAYAEFEYKDGCDYFWRNTRKTSAK